VMGLEVVTACQGSAVGEGGTSGVQVRNPGSPLFSGPRAALLPLSMRRHVESTTPVPVLAAK